MFSGRPVKSSTALPQLLREWGEPSTAGSQMPRQQRSCTPHAELRKSRRRNGNISSESSSWLQVKSWAALPQLLREWGEPSTAGKLDATAAAELHAACRTAKAAPSERKHLL